MRGLSDIRIVAAWEIGRYQPPIKRAVTLLAEACPELAFDEVLALTLGRQQAGLLALYAATFGAQLSCRDSCRACAEELEFSLPLAQFAAQFESDEGAPASGAEYDCSISEYQLRFRLPDARDMAAAARAPDIEVARLWLLERCVLEARRGATLEPLAALPSGVLAALGERMVELDPGLALELSVVCPACGETQQTALDLSQFVWQALAAQAQRVLDQVDRIARVYHWSEAEVLSLSRARREFYLERVST